MSAHPSDPFDLLHEVPLREPDPARLEADVDLARAEFQREHARHRRGWQLPAVVRSWRSRFVIPLGAGLATGLVMGLWLALPGAGPEAPILADQGADIPGTRLGAQPAPLPDPVAEEVAARYSFEGVELVLRETPGQLVLSFVQSGQDRPFSVFLAEDGVEFGVIDAFIQPRSGQDPLLLVRSEYGGFTNWNAYEIGADAITLSGRLSLLIHDAPSRGELVARLTAANADP